MAEIDDVLPLDDGPPVLALDEALPLPFNAESRHGIVETLGRIGEEFKTGWGERLKGTESYLQTLRDAGLINDLDRNEQTIWQDFFDTMLAGPVRTLDMLLRGSGAAVRGGSQALVEEGVPRELTPQGIFEAFPAGHLTGGPTIARPRAPSVRPRAEPLWNDLARAIEPEGFAEYDSLIATRNALEELQRRPDLALPDIEDGGYNIGGRRTSPNALLLETARQRRELNIGGVPVDPDAPLLETARRFEESPRTRQEALEELSRQPDPTLPDVEGPAYNIGGLRVSPDAPMMETARRFEEAPSRAPEQTFDIGETQIPGDTPLIEGARLLERQLAETNARINEIAPRISDALLEASKLYDPDAPVVPEPAPGTVRFYAVADDTSETTRVFSPDGETVARQGERVQVIDLPENDPAVRRASVAEDAPYQSVQLSLEALARLQPIEAASVEIASLSQRRPSIRQDMARRLRDAGRPADEADAAGAIIESHYRAVADWFEGKLGTARDIYEREAPRIVAGTGAARRGRLSLRDPRATIELFERSDASTFLHETGHVWLEDFRRYAAHPEAPPSLRDAYSVIRDWLALRDGAAPTRRQHEQFARGLERYFMEGVAPTPRLRGVFGKFKDWLTGIYRSVARLNVSLSDDVRRVFDRMVASPDTDLRATRTFDEDARVLAREASLEEAEAVANDIRVMRDDAAQALPPEIENARREARRGPERIELPSDQVEEGGTGPESAGAARANESLGTGRNPPAGKTEAPRTPTEPFERGPTTYLESDGTIRVENLLSPEDIRAALIEAASKTQRFVEPRRGVLSDAEVLQVADELGVNANILDRWAIGRAFAAEEIQMLFDAVRKSSAEVIDTSKRATNEKGIIDYAIARERNAMLQEALLGTRAEAGRALRMFRDMYRATGAEDLRAVMEQTVGDTPEGLMAEARLIAELDQSNQVAALIRNTRKGRTPKPPPEPGLRDMVAEAWISALLSGWKTQLRNIIGNSYSALTPIPESMNRVAFNKIFGSGELAWAEVLDEIEGTFHGAIKGFHAARKTLVDENFYFTGDFASPIDFKFRHAIPSYTINVAGIPVKVGGNLIRIPMRLLNTADSFFKAVAFEQETHILARREAVRRGLEGADARKFINDEVANPSDALMLTAMERARYQTFTTPLGKRGQMALAFINANPELRFLFPFVRTPVNLFKYGLERTPLGFAMREVRDNMLGRNGEVAQATQAGRMAVGNMVLATGLYYAANELLSGGGPLDRTARETQERTGKLPYAFRLGDTWISFLGLEPLTSLLQLAGDFVAISRHVQTDDPDFEKLSALVTLAFWRQTGEKLGFRSTANLFGAVTDYQRYGEGFLGNFFASFIPSIVAQHAQAQDPIMREARSFADMLRMRIPKDSWLGDLVGDRGDLFPKLDLWGREISIEYVGPSRVSSVVDDPVDNAMQELGLHKARPMRTIDGIELTDAQYYEYAKSAGQLSKRLLDSMVTPRFRQLPPGQQRAMITSTIERARKTAASAVRARSIGTSDDLVRQKYEERASEITRPQR